VLLLRLKNDWFGYRRNNLPDNNRGVVRDDPGFVVDEMKGSE